MQTKQTAFLDYNGAIDEMMHQLSETPEWGSAIIGL
jgi:hypothetical protein